MYKSHKWMNTKHQEKKSNNLDIHVTSGWLIPVWMPTNKET